MTHLEHLHIFSILRVNYFLRQSERWHISVYYSFSVKYLNGRVIEVGAMEIGTLKRMFTIVCWNKEGTFSDVDCISDDECINSNSKRDLMLS